MIYNSVKLFLQLTAFVICLSLGGKSLWAMENTESASVSPRIIKVNEIIEKWRREGGSVSSLQEQFDSIKKILRCKTHSPYCYSDLSFKEGGYSNSMIAIRDSEVIKKFAADETKKKKAQEAVKEGLEDLLYSLVAFRWIHPNHTCNLLKVVRIHDAVLCTDSLGFEFLAFRMEKAKGGDIDSFMNTPQAVSVINACAQYLAIFHKAQAERHRKIYKEKYLEHSAAFFHRLSQDPIKGQENESRLFKLHVGKQVQVGQDTFLTSDNIIQSFSEDEQRTYIEFIKRTRVIFEKCAGEVFRALNESSTSAQNYYWTTLTHGDAHRHNLFYNPDLEDGIAPSQRITMIDYSSIVRTYGGIGDPAEDVGRFLGSLWDWASEPTTKQIIDYWFINQLFPSDAVNECRNNIRSMYISIIYKSIYHLQKFFIDAYLSELGEPYKNFEKIFIENCNFYKLRYYRAIFNSKKRRKENKNKKILFEFWKKEMEFHKSDFVHEYKIELEEHSKKKEKSHLPWNFVQKSEEVLHYLPDRADSFVEAIPQNTESKASYLIQLHNQLQKSGTATVTSQVAIAGMGGIGKTSLALEYAHEALENGAYHLIWWLPSEKPDPSLKEHYKDILQKINPELIQDGFHKARSIKDWKQCIEQYKEPNHKWLLIYDNARSSESLKDMIPKKDNIHILITSRYDNKWDGSSLLKLKSFSEEESINYLLNVTNLSNNTKNRDIAGKVAEKLANLPVALSIAANYVKLIGGDIPTSSLFEKFLEEFDKDPDSRNPMPDDQTLSKRLVGIPYRILEKELGNGSEIARIAKDMMVCCAYLDPDFIPESIILEKLEEEDRAKAKEALEKLCALSLIKNIHGDVFSVHRLIQKVIQSKEKGRIRRINSIFREIVEKNFCNTDEIKITMAWLPTCLNPENNVFTPALYYGYGTKKQNNTEKIGDYNYICEKSKKSICDHIEFMKFMDTFPKEVHELGDEQAYKIFAKLQDAQAYKIFYAYVLSGGSISEEVTENINKLKDTRYHYLKNTNIDGFFIKFINNFIKVDKLSDAEAMAKVGFFYENGRGVKQNYKKALECYKMAVENGHREAIKNIKQIGYNHLPKNGKNLPINYKQAIECFEIAAKLGDVEAMNQTASLYELKAVVREQGKKQCKEKAKFWRDRAKEAGYKG